MHSRFPIRTRLTVFLLAGALALPALGQSQASALSAVSALPLASVVAEASTQASVQAAQIPAALSEAGAMLVVKAVQSTARGTVYVLERASDAARVSVEVAGKVAEGSLLLVGTAVTVSVISAGVVLSAAGRAIAFVPNEVGRALLHNQRVSQ